MARADDAPSEPDTSRLGALSNGVFAIAATLLLLDLKVLDDAEAAHGLRHYVAGQWPAYVAFVATSS